MRGLAIVTTCISLVSASATTNARAEAETPKKAAAGFGKRGTFLIAVDNVLGFEVEKFGRDEEGSSNMGSFPGVFGPRLGLHGAFSSGVTLGSNLGLSLLRASQGSGDGSGFLAFQVSPRVGYAGSVSSSLGFWLRAGPSFRVVMPDGDDATVLAGLGGELFLVATPVDHFGVMFGPTCDVGVAGDRERSRYTSYGLSIGLVADL